MLLVDSISKNLTPWVNALNKHLPANEVVTYHEAADLSQVKMAVVWGHRADLFRKLPNLRLVSSLGAGVDHIMNDPNLPEHVHVSRVVSEHLTQSMSNFCLGAVLYFHKQFDKYSRDKAEKRWHQEFDPEIPMVIGILGLGVLGHDMAKKLRALGFEVHGLSRSGRQSDGIITYDKSQMHRFLSHVNTLVCMLPYTSETRGIINQDLLRKLPMGSYLINVGRGKQQVDEDILEALENGRLRGAFLDVFPQEPLPSESPLWEHPKVFITPHIAVVTKIEAAVPQIIENYKRIKNGNLPMHRVDKTKGY